MSGRVKITDVSSGLFRDKLTIVAEEDCERVWDSLFGPRRFFLREGCRIRAPVGKRLYRSGEVVRFEEVCTTSNAFDFPWQWAY